MKVILRAFGVFEREYDAPIRSEREELYFVHRNRTHLFSMMRDVPELDQIPDKVMRKAKFTWEGKHENGLPVYEFSDLE